MIPLNHPSQKEIIEAIDGNLVAKVKYYPSFLPGMSVHRGLHLEWIDSREQTSTFNIICNARMSASEAQATLEEVEAYYHSRNLPVCWWIGPSSKPSNLVDLLKSRGWTYETTDLGLAADLRKIPIQQIELQGLSIERIKESKGIMDFAEVFASFFEPREAEALRRVYRKVADYGFRDEDPLQNFIAYFEGKPVATSSYFMSNGVAGFYDCLTIPTMRRKGIGQAMMMKRFEEVLTKGVYWATLSSSHDSRGLYQRLGFQEYCEFSTFVRQ